MLVLYAFTHFLVDFSCAYFIYSRFLNPSQWVLCLVLYNFCAFAMQAPLGLLCDRLNKNAAMAALGCVIVALSAIFSKYSVAACVIAGIGNAFFHLGGGLDILNESTEKSGKLGVFVSPGAFGIYFGTMLGKTRTLSYILPMLLLFAAAFLILLISSRRNLLQKSANAPLSFISFKEKSLVIAAICFFLVVILRSLAGNLMAFPWKKGTWGLLFTCGVVLGKTFGGFLADRFGAVRSGTVTLGLSAILFCFADHPVPGVLAVFLFNMTMPLTLWAIARCFPNLKGFTFGLLTLALFLGLVPVIAQWIPSEIPNVFFSVTSVFSAVILLYGFRKGELC